MLHVALAEFCSLSPSLVTMEDYIEAFYSTIIVHSQLFGIALFLLFCFLVYIDIAAAACLECVD